MRIYFSSAREDLPVARELASLLTLRLPQTADAGELTIYLPPDDAAATEAPETLAARAEQWMAESAFVVLLLSPAALRDPGIARDLDQVRRLRAADAVKLFVTVVVRPIPPISLLDLPLDGLRTIHAVARPLGVVADELAEYATWRPRQTDGRIYFAPPPPDQRAARSPLAPPRPDDEAPAPEPSATPSEQPPPPEPYSEPWVRLGPPTVPATPPPPDAPSAPSPPPAQSVEPPAPASPPAQSVEPPPIFGEERERPPIFGEERERGITYAPPPPPAPGSAQPPDMLGSVPPSVVGRATGSPAPSKKATGPVSDMVDASTLQFSAYHPNTVAVETWQTLLVYTYLADALAQIEADAGTFTELGSAPTLARGQTARAVARGVELIIEPHMEGVTFSPKRETFTWRGDWRRSLFRFSGAAALAGQTPRGWIDIYAAPMIPVARIDLAFPFHTGDAHQLAVHPPRGMIITSNIYDAVFISYSHRDTEAFRQACAEYRRFQISVYTDELLEAGAQYERELGQMIARANVFHLLWSPNTAVSGECRKEWMAALAREPSERFIKPWYWKQPLAALPEEFVQHRISFKYEPLKRRLWRPQTWF